MKKEKKGIGEIETLKTHSNSWDGRCLVIDSRHLFRILEDEDRHHIHHMFKQTIRCHRYQA